MNLKTLLAAGVAAASIVACAAPAPTSQSSQSASQPGAGSSNISVKDAWARPAIPVGAMNMGEAKPTDQSSTMNQESMAMGGMSAAYMVIENKGSAPDTLMSANGDVAGTIEVHETKEQNGMMSMQEMTDGLDVPANGSATLKPGGYHIMLIDLKKDIKPGDTFKLTLRFKSGVEIPVDVSVREP